MADLYGTNSRSSSLESEEMSSFLHNLLLNSLTTPPPAADTSFGATSVGRSPILSNSDDRFQGGIAASGSFYSSTEFNFSDPCSSFPEDTKECKRGSFSSTCAVDSDGITSSLKRNSPSEKVGREASEAPANPAPPKNSKRSRAAEVHNLSEKRRRRRINEKMKALQNLIPNSNKTDKASMLDEAIEYLKQLQLQVQMLTMRNGLSLHPFSLSPLLPTTQLPRVGMRFDEGSELLNTNGEGTLCRNLEISKQSAFDQFNPCTTSNQPTLMPPVMDISNLEAPFGLEATRQNQHGCFNQITSSKVLNQEER